MPGVAMISMKACSTATLMTNVVLGAILEGYSKRSSVGNASSVRKEFDFDSGECRSTRRYDFQDGSDFEDDRSFALSALRMAAPRIGMVSPRSCESASV